MKNYIVVGGSSGIGLELVKLLANEGNQVFAISRTSKNLDGMSNVTFVEGDVTQDDFTAVGLPDVIHGVAYCPGSIQLKPFRALKPSAFLEDFNINVLGAVRVLQQILRPLKKANGASVVFFSTVAVAQGMSFHASVASAKGAVEGLTKSLAAELAPRIRVNCIAPSLTDTPLAARLLSSPEKQTASNNRHPLKRYGQPKEIAELAHFLLSEKATWMSGQVIGMDGGLSTLRT